MCIKHGFSCTCQIFADIYKKYHKQVMLFIFTRCIHAFNYLMRGILSPSLLPSRWVWILYWFISNRNTISNVFILLSFNASSLLSDLLLLINVLLGSFDLSVFQNLHCDEKSSMMHFSVSTLYLFIHLFTFLFNICWFDWFYLIKKTGLRIISNIFRSISSPIDNVSCSRCWLAKRFKTFFS